MRTLDFSGPKGKARFDTLYGGFVNSPRGFDKKETRVANKILDKLEAVAKPITGVGKDARVQYELDESAPGRVTLEDAEFELVVKALDENRWIGQGIRLYGDLSEWLESIVEAPREK